MKRIPWIIALLTVFAGCQKPASSDALTGRIQYDVFIKSPDADLDWYVQNMEGKQREEFVKRMMDMARNGEYEVFDVISFRKLTHDEVAERGSSVDIVTLQRETAPFDSFDTLIRSEVRITDVTKVRFLEEWAFNKKGTMDKKVLAICPMAENYTDSGDFKGYLPLYWISLDKPFPLAGN